MSQRRSGLLSGLVVGFIAMLLGAAAYAACGTFFYRLPYEARWFAGDPALVFPVVLSAAAGTAFLLTLVRVLRMRRKTTAAENRAEEEQPEPEYRDPFEPVQPPKPTSTAAAAGLFTPRDPNQDPPPATR
jgi:hypothetical protein